MNSDRKSVIFEHYRSYLKHGLTPLAKVNYQKRPIGEQWEQSNAIGMVELDEMLDAGQTDGLCLRGGVQENGDIICFIDFDGIDAEDRAREWFKDCNTGWVQSTPSGGVHLAYRVDDEWGCLARRDMGIDVKCVGGQVVAAPSVYSYTPKECESKGLPVGTSGSYVLKRDDKPSKANFRIVARLEQLFNHHWDDGVKISNIREVTREERAGYSDDQIIDMLGFALKDWGSSGLSAVA